MPSQRAGLQLMYTHKSKRELLNALKLMELSLLKPTRMIGVKSVPTDMYVPEVLGYGFIHKAEEPDPDKALLITIDYFPSSLHMDSIELQKNIDDFDTWIFVNMNELYSMYSVAGYFDFQSFYDHEMNNDLAQRYLIDYLITQN